MIADIAGKLPGRGAWVTADIEIVRKAVTGGKLARHLGKDAGRTQVNAEFLFENLAFQVSRQLAASLSMLRRAEWHNNWQKMRGSESLILIWN